MEPKFTNIIILFLTAILQNIFFTDFFLNLYLLLLLIIICNEDHTKGDAYYFALFGGLIYDLFLSTTLGFGIVSFLALTFANKKLRYWFQWRDIVFLIIYFVALIAFEYYHFGFHILSDKSMILGRYWGSVFSQYFAGIFVYTMFRYVQENIWPKKI